MESFEPTDISKKIFDILDKVSLRQDCDGFISPRDVKLTFKLMQLFPPQSTIQQIFNELKINRISFEQVAYIQFIQIRRIYPSSELNILADFKKFEDKRYKGYISRKSFAKALCKSGFTIEEALKETEKVFKCDVNGVGLIGYKNLYNYKKKVLPKEWVSWISQK